MNSSQSSRQKRNRIERDEARTGPPPLPIATVLGGYLTNWSVTTGDLAPWDQTGVQCHHCGLALKPTDFLISHEGSPAAVHHRDCFFASLVGDKKLIEEYMKESMVQNECALLSTGEGSDSGACTWWMQQQFRASFLKADNQVVDWLSGPWSWAGVWNNDQVHWRPRPAPWHAITKKVALAFATLLQHYGDSSPEGGAMNGRFPPVALGFAFYRSLSIFCAPDSCRAEKYEKYWGMPVCHLQLCSLRNDTMLSRPPSSKEAWCNVVRGLLPPHGTNLFDEDWDPVNSIVEDGQADILTLLLAEPLRDDMASICLTLALIAVRGWVVFPLTTVKVLMERHVHYHRIENSGRSPDFCGENGFSENYNLFFVCALGLNDADIVVFAMELWPEISTKYLKLPFSQTFSGDCATRVLLQTHPKPIDWWEILDALFDSYIPGTHFDDNDEELDRMIKKLIDQGAKIPQGYMLSFNLTHNAELSLLEYLFSVEPTIVVDPSYLAQHFSEFTQEFLCDDELAAFEFLCQHCKTLEVNDLYTFTPGDMPDLVVKEATPFCGGLASGVPLTGLECLFKHHPCDLNQIGLKTTRGNFTPLQFLVSLDPEILCYHGLDEKEQEPGWWEEVVLMLLGHGADPNCCPSKEEAEEEEGEKELRADDEPPPPPPLPPSSPFLSFVQHPRATPQLMQKLIQCGANVSDPSLDQQAGLFSLICSAREKAQ